MKYYNYEDLGILSAKEPPNTHLIWEVSISLIFMVDSSNPTILLKSIDKGDNWSTVATRTQDIMAGWHDRDNDKIWLVDCDMPGDQYDVWNMSTDGNDTETSIDSSSGADAGGVWVADIFIISGDVLVWSFQEITANGWLIVDKVTVSPFVQQDALDIGTSNIYDWYKGTVYGGTYRTCQNRNGLTGVRTMTYVHGTTTIAYGYTYTGYLQPISLSMKGIASHLGHHLFIARHYLTPTVNKLLRWTLSTPEVLGEYNIALMLDRNTVSGVTEKAFHMTEPRVYQLHPYILHQLYYIAKISATTAIIAITDNFLICDDVGTNEFPVYELTDHVNYLTRVEFTHEIGQASKGSLGLNRDLLKIEKGMFIQIKGNYVSEPSAYVYPATYDFETDEVGDEPSGFTSNNGTNCTTEIIESLDGHKKVLELYDNNGAGVAQIYRTITQSANQIIELWLAKSSIAANKDCFIELKEGATRVIYLRLQDDDLDYYASAAWSSIKDDFIVASTLFHVKIVLNDTDNTFDLYIDGDLEGQGLSFENNSTISVDTIKFDTDSGDSDYYFYVDSVGLSSDSIYVSGDNTHWQHYQEGEDSFEDEETSEEGDYYGTYSFEDEVGETGTSIGFVDSATLHDGECIIVASWQDHKSVLRLQDDATAGEDPNIDHNETQATVGTRELWIGTNDISKIQYYIWKEDASTIIGIRFTANEIQYRDSLGAWQTIQAAANNTLYYLKVVWRADDTQDIYIDGTKQIDNVATPAMVSGINLFRCQQSGDSTTYLYLDAYGDPDNDANYNVGDNINPFGRPSDLADFIDTYAVGNSCEVSIIPMFDNHKKVLKIYDNSTTKSCYFINTFSSGQTSGTIEFKVRGTDTTKRIDLDIFSVAGAATDIMIRNGGLYHWDGAFNLIKTMSNDTWYHIKYVFDCATDTLDVYVDRILEKADLSFRTNATTLTYLYFITELASSDFSNYIDAIGYSWSTNYAVGDNLSLSNGITQGIEDSVQFEGIVVDFDGERLQKVWLESPAKKELERKPRGDFSGRSDEIMTSLVSIYCKYITIGTLSSGTVMGTITYAGDKTLQAIFNELALFEKWIWKLGPQGRLYFNDGTVASYVNLRVDARKTDKLWMVKTGDVREPFNYFYLKGAIVAGVQLVKELEEADDLVSQQQFGYNPFEKTYASFNAQGILDTLTSNVKARLKETPLVVEHWHYDAELGMLSIGEIITFKYKTNNVDVASDSFLINRVIFKAKQNAGGYTIADELI